jgi:hypothetical protein
MLNKLKDILIEIAIFGGVFLLIIGSLPLLAILFGFIACVVIALLIFILIMIIFRREKITIIYKKRGEL